ncbi:MAG TPA: chloride channel protein, partial [Acidimicrobiia bacterium]
MHESGQPLVRTRYFWTGIARASFLGLFMGIVVLLYLAVEDAAIELLWPEEIDFDPFEGPGIALFILPVGGLLVALLYRLFKLPHRLPSFIDELAEGRVDPKHAPGVVLVGLASLISGASIGPEAPMASAGGGSGTYLAERRDPSDVKVAEATYAGVSGAFGGLMTSPLLGTILGLELQRPRALSFVFTYLVPGIISATVAFAIVYPISGNTFLG